MDTAIGSEALSATRWNRDNGRIQPRGPSGGGGEHTAPRRFAVLGALALSAKAEIVVGVLLVIRHRTVRLAALLAFVAIGMGVLGSGDPDQTNHHQIVFVVAGSLAAVAGSRVLSPGAALAAARRAAGPWWLAPSGRLTGAALAVSPVIAIAAISLAAPVTGAAAAAKLSAIAGCYAVALGALTLALAPLTGATAAGTLGLLAAWLGAIPPSGIQALLAEWPYVQRPAMILWNALPLDWRATRWFRVGGLEDPAIFAIWIVVGIVVAAWAAARVYRGERLPHQGLA